MTSTECPICFCEINNENILVTECCHKFHSRCLIDMMARGSFQCPLCRFVLGTAPNNEEEDMDDEWSDIDESEDNEDNEDNELYTDHALRGLRFFTNNLLGRPHTIRDLEDEKSYYKFDNEYNFIYDNDELYSDYSLRGLRLLTSNITGAEPDNEDILEEEEDNMPTPNQITEFLVKQKITYEDLVKCILYRCFDTYIGIDPLLKKSNKKVMRDINILITEHKKL